MKRKASTRWNTVKQYEELHDGLSDMIEGGRLKETDIPDDYEWLVQTLINCTGANDNET